MDNGLQDKPYIVLLGLYWICLLMRASQADLSTLRSFSLVTVCLMALSLCPSWALLLTVPAVWLVESRQ